LRHNGLYVAVATLLLAPGLGPGMSNMLQSMMINDVTDQGPFPYPCLAASMYDLLIGSPSCKAFPQPIFRPQMQEKHD
jgi:hypothetical protein